LKVIAAVFEPHYLASPLPFPMALIKTGIFPGFSGCRKLSFWLPSLSVAAVVAAGSTPAFSAVATFDLRTSPTPVNGSSLDFYAPWYSGTIKLTVSNPAGGPFPSAGGVNSSPSGLCSWAQNVAADMMQRCNYVDPGNTTTLNGFDFTFDKNVRLKQFEVSQFVGLSGGSITFGNLSPITLSGTGVQVFGSDLFVAANTPITVTTSGTLSNPSNSGVFRMNNLLVEDVPGPLPLLGAGMAFQFSRRLRKRTKKSSIL
jgi:hypothetical protein